MEEKRNFLREKLLGNGPASSLFLKLIVFLFSIIIVLDLIYLNYKIFNFNSKKADTREVVLQSSIPSVASDNSNDKCPQSCISQIDMLLTPAVKKQTVSVPNPSYVREFFVPFGSGISSSGDWQDVSGIQAHIDGDAYGSIKTALFEASINVPTGNQTVNVRLYNVTAAHPVWFSEVVFTGGGVPQFLVSQPITLEKGENLYKVQMKTQLKYPAYLNQARVHIIKN